MNTAVSNAYYSGAYEQCTREVARASTNVENKSYLIRSLICLNRIPEARSLLKPPNLLDEALLLWSEGYSLRGDKNNVTKWSPILMKANLVKEKLGEQPEVGVEVEPEVAALLSAIYSWAGKLEEAYALAAGSPTLEG